ncbi:MAG: aldehyde dehydrogenase family protein, partial [Cyanobacteria bacterium]|nr:aldehyde dehydrogenase family protein [Cyanobacteriota bacterium]
MATTTQALFQALANSNPKGAALMTQQPVETLQNFISGKWVPSLGTEAVAVFNPANKEVLANTPLGSAQDVDHAVNAAQKAFKTWRKVPTTDRVQYLFKLKTLLEAHADELAKICTLENGKTLAESHGDLRRGIQMVETACGMATLMMGKSSEDIAAGIDCHAIRRPMGVFTAITPFNFPAMVPFWFWPFAIASGNTFVLKPSERVPLTQMRIFELIQQTGLPEGVINLVHGSKDVVNALIAHPEIKGISFVGSTPVAKHVYTTGTAQGKRVQALGGAKNFMVVLPDAVMDTTVKTVLESCTGCAGQRCLAGSVILGVGEAYQHLEKRMIDEAKLTIVGNGLDPKSQIGPVISQVAKDRVMGLIQSAID